MLTSFTERHAAIKAAHLSRGYQADESVSYPGLPADLGDWYAYKPLPGGGHTMMVIHAGDIVEQQIAVDDALVDYAAPMLRTIPVRMVLRLGYTIRGGFVVVDLPGRMTAEFGWLPFSERADYEYADVAPRAEEDP